MESMVQLVHLELVVDRSIQAPVARVCSAADAVACVAPFIAARAQECIAVLALDAKLHPLAVGLISIGSVDRAGLCLADLFRFALATHAVRLILAHNHPSGDPTPSPHDWQVTEDAALIAVWLGLELTDHLVMGPGKAFCSMRLDDPARFKRMGRRRTRAAAEPLRRSRRHAGAAIPTDAAVAATTAAGCGDGR